MREEKITYRIEYDSYGRHFVMNLTLEDNEEEAKSFYDEWRTNSLPLSAKNVKLLKITVSVTTEQIG
jgi:hypothetical protein